MRIGVIVANIGMTPEALELRRQFLQARARPGTEIVLRRNDVGPASMESVFEWEEASTQIVRQMMQMQVEEPCDAYIPWCAGDPGVIAGRERLDVPVVGPLQSACALANMLGYRFSVISPNTDSRIVRARVRALGMGEQLASVRMLNRPVLELRQDLDATRRLIVERIDDIVAQDGADAVVLSCMALYGLAETIEAAVPVIDPATAALQMAETLIAMRLRHARSAYPFPKSA